MFAKLHSQDTKQTSKDKFAYVSKKDKIRAKLDNRTTLLEPADVERFLIQQSNSHEIGKDLKEVQQRMRNFMLAKRHSILVKPKQLVNLSRRMTHSVGEPLEHSGISQRILNM